MIAAPARSLFEHRQTPFARIAPERVERLVDDHPARLVQRKPGECQQPLLLLVELAIPARDSVEHGAEPAEAHLRQRRGQLGLGEICRLPSG